MRTRVLGSALKGVSGASLPKSSRVDSTSLVSRSWVCRQCRSTHPSHNQFLSGQSSSQRQLRSRENAYRSARLFSSSQRPGEESNSTGGEHHELPSKREFRRSKTAKQLSHMMDNIQTNIFVAGQRLNDLTGYSAIEALKKEIQIQEDLVQTTRDDLQKAKEKYTQAITQRSQSQREVNELLQRKHSWTPQDLERFTSLYRSDHANEQSETEAQAAVTLAEHAAEEAASRLNANILSRYHEEQIWSDKIRRMSTWGTWGLMGVNVFLFLIFQIGVEPWRRRRLVKGFEEKVVEALEKETAAQKAIAATAVVGVSPLPPSNSSSMSEIPALFADRIEADSTKTPLMEDPAQAMGDPVSLIGTKQGNKNLPDDRNWRYGWKNAYRSYQSKIFRLFSTQQVELRQVDVTTKFIEGALSSAVVISLLAAMLRGK